MSQKNLAEIRVLYADTDAMGVVYHTNYIKWFEIGRAELFRQAGVTHARMDALGIYLPVTRAFCHYFSPARYDQVILLETEMAYLKKVSMKFTYIMRERGNGRVLTEGYTVHGCTDKEGRIMRIPEEIALDLRGLL